MRLHKNNFAQKGFYGLEYMAYPKKNRTTREQTNNKQTQKWGVNGIDVLCREKALKNLGRGYQIRTYARAG